MEKFLEYGKVPWISKSSLAAEKFFDCGKITFLAAEKIRLIILKANANDETIKTYILNLEQKSSSLAFLAVDKHKYLRLKHKY